MISLKMFKIEKREQVGFLARAVAAVIALLAALLVSMLLVRIAGGSGKDAFISLFQGGLGSKDAILETLVKATPLIFTALAATIAFRGKIWNIGGEGQFFIGAMAAYWAYISFQGVWGPVHIALIVIFGCLGGAFWALIAALLKAYFKVDEIISTVMLNYIAIGILSYLLSGIWKEDGSIYRQTPQVADAARWPIFVDESRLHVGFILALATAVLFYWILKKTPLGYEIRAIGLNPLASKFKGISITGTWIMTLVISGAAAGLGGVTELFAVRYRLTMDLSTGYGFVGIIVAMLAGLNPLAVVPVSIFFAALINGGIRMQIITKVPSALISAIQAIVLIFLLASQVLAVYRLRLDLDKAQSDISDRQIGDKAS